MFTTHRFGGAAVFAVVSLLVLVVLIIAAMKFTADPKPLGDATDLPTLEIHCAGGIYAPVQAIADAYEKEFGVKSRIVKGGSAKLLGTIEAAGRGDIYIAGDDHYLDLAKDKGLVREILPIAEMHLAVATTAGNPKNITSLQDLLRDDIRLSIGLPEGTAVGKATREIFTELGVWEDLQKREPLAAATVMDAASYVTIGTADAAIIWNTTVAQVNNKKKESAPGLMVVESIDLPGGEAQVTLGIQTNAVKPPLALHFARYLTSAEHGDAAFLKAGFTPAKGDTWAEVPELIVHSGTVNRPVIQQAMDEFKAREGVKITTKFEGCGVLTSEMRVLMKNREGNPDLRLPDIYYTCDVAYLAPVHDLYPDGRMMTETDLVILVPKGNPKNITSLEDLARPGIQIAVTNAERSTLGLLTIRLLAAAKLVEKMKAGGNIAVESPRSDQLIINVATGATDAAIVYRTSAMAEAEKKYEIIPIDHPNAKAMQSYSILPGTKYPLLADRLHSWLKAYQERYSEVGFKFLGQEAFLPSTTFHYGGE